MTASEQISSRMNRMSIGQLKDVARQTYEAACNGDVDAETVNDFALAALGGKMMDREFIEFCESL